MNIKRKLASLLVIVMLFSILPAQIFAYPDTIGEFEQYFEDNGFPPETPKHRKPNFITYQTYGFVVYGDPWSPTGDGPKYSRETGRNEHRYLGFTAQDASYTNSLFPNDDRGTKTPLQWTYTSVENAGVSWTKVTDADQKAFMLNTNLQFEGTVYNGLTASWIKQPNAKVLNKASFKNGFSVLTEHKGANGKTYYATLYGQEMGGNTHVDCAVTTPANTYTIKADQQSVTVPVTVKATADLDGTYVKATHIKTLIASFEDKKSPTVGNITTATITKDKILNRNEYTPGTHTVYLQGTAEMVSKLSGADTYMQPGTKAITLIVEPYPSPYVEITATANPAKKQVDGSKDELVTVNVNAALKDYTDTTNIKSWTIFAKLDGEDATLQTKVNPGSVLNSSASFIFTVPKSKFNVNSFKQIFKVTAMATLNRTIDNDPPYQGTTYTYTDFYKLTDPDRDPVPEPPLPGNLPPIAILNVEETIKAGEETSVDGTGSYDTDGYIAGYNMNTTGATVTDSGEGWRNVWYPYTGQPIKVYKASVKATDDKGASDSDSKFITVEEPTVDAKIKVTGKLKANRSVKITNASDSPTHYPIDNTKTVWTLQAVSAGTNADIKFNGVLRSVNELNVIFKKQGVYKATLHVTNTLGYTDSTEYLINIGPDLAPVANYSMATTVIRDVNDYGNATIELLDTSYSLDGDILSKRIWSYAFDSDNDGSFADETYKTIDSGNNTKPILKVSTVGKYHIKLLVQENFTDTLPLYILPADYLLDDTMDKTAAESVVEVINIAPTTSFSMIDKKKVDLVFNVWDTRYTAAEVQTKVNSIIVPALSANDIDANITVADNYDMTSTPNQLTGYSSSFYIRSISSTKDDGSYDVHLGFGLTNTATGRTSYVSNNAQTFAGKSFNGDLYLAPDPRYSGTSSVIRLRYQRYMDDNTYLSLLGASVSSPKIDGITQRRFTVAGYKVDIPSSEVFDIDGSYLWIKSIDFTGNTITIVASGGYGYNNSQHFIFEDKVFKFTSSLRAGNIYLNRHVEYVSSGTRVSGRFDWGPGVMYTIDDKSKYLNALISQHSFRASSKPYVISIADNQFEELADPGRANQVLNQTLEKNVNFVGLGTTTNKTQLQNYIISNNNNGTFIENTSLDAAITSLRDYIIGRENQETPKSQYVVMGEELEYLTFYDDHEDDVKYAEQWKYTHSNPNYFDNPLGTDPQSGINRTVPITQFTKVGVYDVLYRVRDNPYNNSLFENYRLWSEDAPTQLIVHRRPIAAFTPYVLHNSSTNKYYVSAVDKSYDLDHRISRADKGIIQKQWKWKATDASTWQTGVPNDILYGKTYQIQLMVQDMEGAWSTPIVETVSVPDLLVYANPTSLPWQKTDAAVNLGVKINAGTFSRVDYVWTNSTTKPSTGFTSSTSISNNLTQAVQGEWYLHATAYTTEGQSAYNYFGPYQIDKTAPTITPVKSGGVSGAAVAINATIADTGGSLIKDVKYMWTNSTTKPSSGWTVTYGSFSTTHAQDGIWYLHIEATDNAGNVTYIRYNLPHIGLTANPSSLGWRNTNAVVNITSSVTNGTFSKINYKWNSSTSKPTTGWLSTTSSNFNTSQSATGQWYLHAEAFLIDGQSKYSYFGAYQIDKLVPTITADKTNADGNDPVTVNAIVTDAGGSRLNQVKHAWSKSTTKPTTGWSITNSNFSTTQEQEGTWYLHVEASDNAGNVTYKCFGTYSINTFKLEDFKVMIIRDTQLENYYKNPSYSLGSQQYIDRPMGVNSLAVDSSNFDGIISGLTKGYKFEFEIDSTNFNESTDTIMIEPHFYTTDGFVRDSSERDLYWEDSNHQVFLAGEGGHSAWKTITLEASDRIINTGNEATWRGEYLIPGSAWAVTKGTTKTQAKSKDLKKDIIVSFQIKGYKNGLLKFDYNAEQWGKERIIEKYPYLIGDVIRYSRNKNCLDDINVKDNR
ncbi:MAG: hypothetical protein K0S75_470 [Clostridia bacterium]|jgi:hypothetical protein|nr:hypothetical protein [Clostridia bacterium]